MLFRFVRDPCTIAEWFLLPSQIPQVYETRDTDTSLQFLDHFDLADGDLSVVSKLLTILHFLK
jgi:hypothetical protein